MRATNLAIACKVLRANAECLDYWDEETEKPGRNKVGLFRFCGALGAAGPPSGG